MLTVQLIGAAFLLLCIAPLLARDPGARAAADEFVSAKQHLTKFERNMPAIASLHAAR